MEPSIAESLFPPQDNSSYKADDSWKENHNLHVLTLFSLYLIFLFLRLSGLSPFLGETDAETMNYVVNCSWDFDAEAFEQLSEDAKDFISRLLVKEKRYLHV